MREVTKTVLEMFPDAALVNLEPIPFIGFDSMLDLMMIGYHLGETNCYSGQLQTRKRDLLKEHLKTYLERK